MRYVPRHAKKRTNPILRAIDKWIEMLTGDCVHVDF